MRGHILARVPEEKKLNKHFGLHFDFVVIIFLLIIFCVAILILNLVDKM